MILCSELKNGLRKIVTKSQVVTKFNLTKSRLHCIIDNPYLEVTEATGEGCCLLCTTPEESRFSNPGFVDFWEISSSN